MKKIIILIAFIFPFAATAQKRDMRFVIGGGISLHGTGDMRGYNFLNQVDVMLTKRLYISPGIQFTNNAAKGVLTYFEVNYVTAGVNVFTNLNYLLVNKSRHQFAFGAGPMVRFQNSSVPTEIASNLSPSGEQILYIKYDKLRSVSVGYNITPSYSYQYSKRIAIGAKVILQNDTEGDVITSQLVFVGIKL